MPRSAVSPEIKAAALADLASGEQPAIVAARYKLNGATVRSLKARLPVPAVATDRATIATVVQRPNLAAQQLALGELILENLRAKLIATQRIAEHVTTSAWIDKQNAADMAELFECLDRSAIRVLDRLAGRSADEPSGPDPGGAP